MLQKTHQIILDRERKGLVITVYGKIGLFLLFLALTMFSAHTPIETLVYLLILCGSLGFLIFSLFELERKKHVELTGFILLGMDIGIVCILPFLWYFTLNDSSVSRAFMLKTILPSVIFTLMIFNSFSLKPLLPLLFSVASSIFLTILFFIALQDGKSVFSDDFTATVTGPGVHTYLYFTNVLFTVLSGVILFFIAKRARKTVLESAALEVSTARLTRYFSPNIVETVLKEDSTFESAGRKLEIAVMFSDIRGFTSLCDIHPPEVILKLLTDYQKFMVSIIFRFGGTLDKYIGDGIMATFGTPQPGTDDAWNAVGASIAMRAELARFNLEREKQGLFTVRHGIGIHFGPVIAGNIGAENRLEYTVIGDTVNIASRVEGMCKTLETDILVTRNIFDRIPDNRMCSSMGEVSLRGSLNPLEVFSINEGRSFQD